MDDLITKITTLNIGKVEENISISKYTTYKVGGKAKAIVYPKNISSLTKLIKLLKNENVTYKVLGNGSNLLFSDKFYNGILIKLTEFNDIKFLNGQKIRVGAGFSLMKLSMLAAKKV